MKKIFLINSLLFSLAGILGLPSSTPVIAEDLPKIRQISGAEIRIEPISSPEIPRNSATEIKVIDTGSYPKQVLRFTPIPGSKQTTTMTMEMMANSSINGKSNPDVNIPKMKIDIQTEVNKVDENGDIYAEFIYKNPEVISDGNFSALETEQMRSYLKKIEGFKGTFVSDDRGNIAEINYDFSENITAADKHSLEYIFNSFQDISFPFPSESLGIGARWQVINNIPVSSINLLQTTTYELIDINNNTVNLIAKVDYSKDDRDINSSEIPEQMEIEVISFDGTGRAKIEIDLNKIMPVEYSFESNPSYKIKLKNNINNNLQETIIEIESNIKIDLESN